VAYLAGVALLAGALTVTWLSMRAVMDIGGVCASGGPYVVAVECPEGVDWLLPLAIFVGIGGAGLVGWFGSRIGPGFGALVLLAWPALFLSLGWNFLEYGLASPGGWDVSWLLCGVLFMTMGGIPLVVGLAALRRSPASVTGRWASPPPAHATSAQGRATSRPTGSTVAPEYAELAGLLRQVQGQTVAEARSLTVGEATAADDAPSGLVDQLERLARLKEAGALGELEYLQAKQAVIDAASKGGTA
jgi:hypothetical protein